MFIEQEVQAPHVVQDPSTVMEEIAIAFKVALKIDYYFVMLTVAISSFSWCCCAWPVTTEAL